MSFIVICLSDYRFKYEEPEELNEEELKQQIEKEMNQYEEDKQAEDEEEKIETTQQTVSIRFIDIKE